MKLNCCRFRNSCPENDGGTRMNEEYLHRGRQEDNGEWVLTNIGPDWAEAKCSRCGYESESTPYVDFPTYCPNCGAKMDKT